MGVCLGKLHAGGRAIDVHDHPPSPPQATPATLADDGALARANKANHVAPHPPAKEPAVERPAMPPRDGSNVSAKSVKQMSGHMSTGSGGAPRLQRSMTASARSTTKRATFAIGGSSATGGDLISLMAGVSSPAAAAAAQLAAAATNDGSDASPSAPPPLSAQKSNGVALPGAKARHKSIKPELHRVGSMRRVDEKRRGKKPVSVTLDVLLKDERARVGFFKFLESTSAAEAIKEEPPEFTKDLDTPARLKRRASKLTQSRMTFDYREDCVLFWLEISDLLKIPTGGSFHLGLMQDLFDVYVSKHAPRLLPMVSSAEREPLAQYLQDRNADRALLAFKMLLLDVLEIVTAAFDEYVRCDSELGYVQATRSEFMQNVLERLAHVNLGPASSDRRAQLNSILNTPHECRMFREFLQERNSVENLLFVVDALAFEDLVNSFECEHDRTPLSDHDLATRHDYCMRQAQKIFNKYIRYGSKAEICLGGAAKEKLLRSVVEYPIGAQVFNEAVLVCSAELVHSHLDTFYRSHAYAQFKYARSQEDKTKRVSGNSVMRRTSLQSSMGASNAATAGEPQGPTLSEILNGVGVNFFRDFLKEDGAENTLLFYKEAEQFQLLPHGQKHYIQIKARRIFDRFVRRGGKLEIELPMDVRRDILFKLSSPSEFTFGDALKYVVNLWEARHLTRFREHRLYKDMLTAMDAALLAGSPRAATASVDLASRRDSALAVSAADVAGLQGGAAASPLLALASSAVASSSSGDWVDVTRITLREFLELEFLRKYFRHFLEKEQCLNELHFYFEIANFQQLPTSDYLTRQAKKLFSRFCDPQSRECVVLRDERKNHLQQLLAKPSPAMFNKTQDEIFGFFQTTLFPKFQQSEIYRTIQLTHSQLRNARQSALGRLDGDAHDGGRRGGGGGGGAGAANGDAAAGAGTSLGGRGNRRSVGAVQAVVELAEESVSVAMILENQETRSLFLGFAEEIFCTESIYFWLDCNEYKDIPHRNYLKLRAQKIYRKYICGRAKLQVNLESAIIQDVVKGLEDPTRTLFLVAQRSITKMLERDTLPKFRKSKHFQPCVQILRAALKG